VADQGRRCLRRGGAGLARAEGVAGGDNRAADFGLDDLVAGVSAVTQDVVDELEAFVALVIRAERLLEAISPFLKEFLEAGHGFDHVADGLGDAVPEQFHRPDLFGGLGGQGPPGHVHYAHGEDRGHVEVSVE